MKHAEAVGGDQHKMTGGKGADQIDIQESRRQGGEEATGEFKEEEVYVGESLCDGLKNGLQ
ncbi:MAG: hypothetical protein WCI05_07740 [Myxococcales bacterium]